MSFSEKSNIMLSPIAALGSFTDYLAILTGMAAAEKAEAFVGGESAHKGICDRLEREKLHFVY